MIKPTIGRIVWYYSKRHLPDWQPNAAIVAYINPDDTVNLAVFDSEGFQRSETDVFLFQGEGNRPDNNFCEWMPYQIGQAKKEEVK